MGKIDDLQKGKKKFNALLKSYRKSKAKQYNIINKKGNVLIVQEDKVTDRQIISKNS